MTLNTHAAKKLRKDFANSSVCIQLAMVLQAYAYILGLHSRAARAIPIFVVYLATLMHVYTLARHQVLNLASCSCHLYTPTLIPLMYY